MKHLFFLIALFANILYVNISAFWGVLSIEGSNTIYKIYCIVVFFVFLFFYTKQYFNKKIYRNHFISILILVFYIICGVLSGYANDVTTLCLIAYCLPATGIAVFYAENQCINKLVKWIDVFLPVLSISMLFSLRILLNNVLEGTSFYSQSLSYDASYCFLFYLFFLLFGKEYDRFSFFKSKIYRIISLIMLPYLLSVLFFSGGRGALGTIIVGVIFLLYMYKWNYKIKPLMIFSLSIVAITFIVLLLLYLPEESIEIFTRNFNRVFSFFDTNASMDQRTSGRDGALYDAISQISQSPIIGNGLFSYKDLYFKHTELTYPHNIILEVLLQGGIILLLLFSIIMTRLFFKLRMIYKIKSHMIIVLIGIFSFTKLLYSDSYMENPFFWFFVVYLYNVKIPKRKAEPQSNALC